MTCRRPGQGAEHGGAAKGGDEQESEEVQPGGLHVSLPVRGLDPLSSASWPARPRDAAGAAAMLGVRGRCAARSGA